MDPDRENLLDGFFEEAEELLVTFERGVLDLCEAPSDPEVIGRVFRAAHSIKGGGAMFGLSAVVAFTHALESALDDLRAGRLAYSVELFSLLLEALDVLRAVLASARTGSPAPLDEPEVRRRLEGLTAPSTALPGALPERQLVVTFVPARDLMSRGMDPLGLLRDLQAQSHAVESDLDVSAVPCLEELEPEACYLEWRVRVRTSMTDAAVRETFAFVDDLCKLRIDDATIAAKPRPAGEPLRAPEPGASTIRVSSAKLDKLFDLVGELVIAQSMLHETIRARGQSEELGSALAAIDRNTRELQESVTSIRMIPLKNVFRRFPRLVHEASAACGKSVALVVEGEETEIDKGMVDQLVDPLTHLLRNAIDHGVESPAEREAAGKPAQGTVTIRAFHQAGTVVIEVEDDGRGLDTARIREKAVERGLVAAEAPLSESDVHAFVFHPGFSTATSVTDLSGRGVGMDVVKRNVEGLNGSVALSSEPRRGSVARVRLPLTLAILDGMSVRVGEQLFVLPLLSVVESFRPSRQQVRRVPTAGGPRELLDIRGATVPLLRLHEVLGVPDANEDPARGLVCVVEANGARLALVVDDLVAQAQIVVKSLEHNYRRVEPLMGATILGDGRVAMILDVQALSRAASTPSPRELPCPR